MSAKVVDLASYRAKRGQRGRDGLLAFVEQHVEDLRRQSEELLAMVAEHQQRQDMLRAMSRAVLRKKETNEP